MCWDFNQPRNNAIIDIKLASSDSDMLIGDKYSVIMSNLGVHDLFIRGGNILLETKSQELGFLQEISIKSWEIFWIVRFREFEFAQKVQYNTNGNWMESKEWNWDGIVFP